MGTQEHPQQAFDELRPGFEGATQRSINNAKLSKKRKLVTMLKRLPHHEDYEICGLIV